VTAAAYTAPSDTGLSRYLQAAREMPMLTVEEELRLAHLFRDKHDTAAANKLVASHLRLVARVAAGYRGYGLPYSDLISEGNLGMMQAVQRFDPDRGFRLATYAIWWIRAAIQEYVLHSASLVRMGTSAPQKKLFFNLRRIKGQMNVVDDGDLKPEQAGNIAKALDVPVHDVITMNRRMAGPDHSLNVPMHDDAADQWQDHVPDESESCETLLADREVLAMQKACLAKALPSLSQRERRILRERWLKEDSATLEELACEYGVSRERIRQIESRAMVKLRKATKSETGSNMSTLTVASRAGRSSGAKGERDGPGTH
jgi:RNA polymerase sigma-32 factor